jgi:hypothetical protein
MLGLPRRVNQSPGHRNNNIELEAEPFCHSLLLLALNAFHLSRRLDPRSRTSRPHSTVFLSLAHLQATAARQSQEPAPAKEDTPCCAGRDGGERTEHVYASPKNNASRPKKSIDKKCMRPPSPSSNQRQFPDDAYSPDDIDDATPGPDRSYVAHISFLISHISGSFQRAHRRRRPPPGPFAYTIAYTVASFQLLG